MEIKMGSNTATLAAPVAEIVDGLFYDEMVVTELRGSYPSNIPYMPDVNIEELTAGDTDPLFLTLPIGQVDSRSGNKRFYNEEWIQELERQTISERAIGIMGHIKPEDRASAFPDEAIHWVGVQREGNLLWGKGYVPPGSARDRIKRYKATGRKIATSIYASAQGVWNQGIDAYVMQAKTMRLSQIDIAPYDRAGVSSLGRVPVLTAEMTPASSTAPLAEPSGTAEPVVEEVPAAVEPPTPEPVIIETLAPTKDPVMERTEIISELTVADISLIPQAVRDAIGATAVAAIPVPEPVVVPPAPEIAMVSEMCVALGGVEPEALPALVTELVQARETTKQQTIQGHISELIDNDVTGVKVKTMRPVIRKMLAGRVFNSVEEVDAAFQEVVDDPEIAELLGREVQDTMGPPQTTPVAQQFSKTGTFYKIPQLPAPKKPATSSNANAAQA
jgi:hypothetical protein